VIVFVKPDRENRHLMLLDSLNWLDCKRVFAIKILTIVTGNLKREVAAGIVDFLKDAAGRRGGLIRFCRRR
jgi:hypothetical protein